MKSIQLFVAGAICGISLFMLFGFRSGEDSIGRYVPVSVTGGRAGLFIVDTKTGITKIAWGSWRGGQIGMPFEQMANQPREQVQ